MKTFKIFIIVLLIGLLTFTVGVSRTSPTNSTTGITDDGGCCCDRACDEISIWCCPVAQVSNANVDDFC